MVLAELPFGQQVPEIRPGGLSSGRRFMLELSSYTALEHEAIPRVYEWRHN